MARKLAEAEALTPSKPKAARQAEGRAQAARQSQTAGSGYQQADTSCGKKPSAPKKPKP